MRLYKEKKCLAFDDVLLVPNKKSNGISRLGVDISTKIGPFKLDIPIISSPMDTVTEVDMAIAISRLGGMGVLHRFMPIEQQASMIRVMLLPPNELGLNKKPYIVPAVGVAKEGFERIKHLYREFGNDIDMFSIDVANGYHILVEDAIKYVQDLTGGSIPIMAGNVATNDGFMFLAELGVKAVRVGIGSGSICQTRIQTGFGMPLLSSIDDCTVAAKYTDVSLIADGGIKYPMDLVKSIAAGADAVMCGGILAGTKEAPGEIIYTNDGKAWKKYRGMACYSDDTEVLTKEGWKFFSDLTYEDEMATLNPNSNKLEYHAPNKIINYDYNGEMYDIKSKFIDLRVTPNHKLYVAKSNSRRNYTFNLVEAQDAFVNNKSYMYKKSCDWDGKTQKFFTIPNTDISIPMNDWLYFYGFWLAEGSTCAYIQKSKYICDVISYSNNDLNIMERCNKVLKNAGIKYSMRYRNGNYETKFHNKGFYAYLSQFGKAADKFVDSQFLDLSSEHLEYLLQGIYDGDGCKSRNSIFTTSVRLKDDISEISLKTNRVPKISISRVSGDNYKHFVRNHNLYSVNISKICAISKVPDNGVSKVQYNGKIYCVDVQNHILYVRRNNKMVWCGNSEEIQVEKNGGLKKGTCAEGVSTLTEYKGSLERVIDEFAGGMRSALTYNNSDNLKDLKETAEFIVITSSGLTESHAYGTAKR